MKNKSDYFFVHKNFMEFIVYKIIIAFYCVLFK